MRDYIEERAIEIANYIIQEKATIRQTAKKFGVSKSTVHKDVTERLFQINPSLAHEAIRAPHSWWTCYPRKIFTFTCIEYLILLLLSLIVRYNQYRKR